MAIGRQRKSSSRFKKIHQVRRKEARRQLHLESLEERQLLATGPQLIGVHPNSGELLKDGDILNEAPRQLQFNFNDGQVIDASTLGAIQITRSGGDLVFDSASARTDFGTNGAVVMQFDAIDPGPGGNNLSLQFSKSNFGVTSGPRIRVEDKAIFVELNTFAASRTTANGLAAALNADPEASALIRATRLTGSANADITQAAITYSPVQLGGANVAEVSTNFNTGTNLQVIFRAVNAGPDGNGLQIVVTKSDHGGPGNPTVELVSEREIHIDLNTNPAAPTTAGQLVDFFNAQVDVSAVATANLVVGNPASNIAAPTINYSPLLLNGAHDVPIQPGYVGLGSSDREVIFRFAEPLPDDVYRIDIGGSGDNALRNVAGMGLGDLTDDGIDNGEAFSQEFELDLGARILAVVPQPIVRTSTGALTQNLSEIEVFFNDDNLDPITATNPFFYQLIYTAGTVEPQDDIVFRPIAVQYSAESDRAKLVFRSPLHQLAGGDGAFRLRIGTDETLPLTPQTIDATGADVGSSADTSFELVTFDSAGPALVVSGSGNDFVTGQTFTLTDDAHVSQTFVFDDFGGIRFSGLTQAQVATNIAAAINRDAFGVSATAQGGRVGLAHISQVELDPTIAAMSHTSSEVLISSAIEPQVYTLDFPGSNDELGHRDLPEEIFSHLEGSADTVGGVTTVYYNFRADYGSYPANNPLSNLINEQQKQRTREAFTLWERYLGVRFVETASQGITIARGDLRVLDPFVTTGPGNRLVLTDVSPEFGRPLVVLDNAENWYDSFGSSDNPARPDSFFETVVRGIGSALGLGDTTDLPPGTWMGNNPALGFGQEAEGVYPGSQDIVHGQHLYRPDSRDVDLYRFEIVQSGELTLETVAERMSDSSLLDTTISLYRETSGGWELVARNDDYFSDDSFLRLNLDSGVYLAGVSASGNDEYNPLLEDSGFGGGSEGRYDLRLNFRSRSNSSITDKDNSNLEGASDLTRSTPLDGDGDGVPGGVFNYWFNVDVTPVIVDRSAPNNGNGSLLSPYNEIDVALNNARPGDVVRIVGNGGTDGSIATPEDALAYEIGFDSLGRPLRDGAVLSVPRDVSVMVDRGAVLKLRRGSVITGSVSPTVDRSGGSFQVLGTPRLLDLGGQVMRDSLGQEIPGSVFFTSWNDETLGGDTTPTATTEGQSGDWGGLLFRNDIDQGVGRESNESEGIFPNYINQADIRFGGGIVTIAGVSQVVAPVFAANARPTVTNSTITQSADAAIAATPNSFEESRFTAGQDPAAPFISDYTRVGPEIHGNTVVDNSINGLFIRVRTPAGQDLQPMTVSGRWNDTDIVHVLSENLRVQGDPGGALQTLVAPNVSVVGVRQEGSGTLAAGAYTYRMTYVDADGQESPASDPTDQVLVNGFQGVRLSNLPLAPAGYTARRIYRSEKDSFVLVAELTGTTRTYLDDGTTAGGLLQGSNRELQARLHGRLAIDAGAIVKLNGAGLETGFGAQLIAEGNAGREVIFTSLQDDRFGTGGTFSTSTRGDLQPGAWSGLYLSPASSASIDHAVIAYGGGVTEIPGTFTGFNAIEVHQADARIVNTLFELNADGTGGQGTANRAGRGSNAPGVVFVRGAQPVVVNNVLQDNRGPVVSIDVNALNFEPVQDLGRSTGTVERFGSLVNNRGPMIRENRLDNNELNGMQVRGGTLTTEGVWDDTDIVHLVLDDTIYVPDFHTYGGLRLQSSGDASLVVKLEGPDAGFTAVGQPLDITDRVGGTLQIVGTTGHPVVLTAVADDTVGAGFTPDGRPQNNTRDDGTNGDAGSLPTGPEVDNGTLIDNDVPVNIPGHFEIQPGDGGSVFFGSSGATAQGLTQLFVNQNWIFDFDNYVDVLSDGGAISLSTTNITMPATLVSPDLVVSEGNFTGPGGQVDWRVETFLNDGEAIVYNRLTLSSAAPLGDIRYISYLDEDVQGISDDLLWTVGTPGQADFRAFTLDGPERIGFSHGGIYEPGPDLVNATYTGWAADQYFDLQSDILGPGTNYTIPGNIDLVDLPPGVDASLGDINGPEDVTTAFAWNVDPTATTATMVSLLELVPRDPTLAGGQWRSVQLLSGANDRNVGTVTEEETGSRVDTGTNDQPNVAQHVVDLAPNEKSGDDNLRLGVEIHGSLNHPQDLDVYSFEAVGGTEVWLDIDSTSSSLDTVLELIDEDGTVLARSNNSTAEARDPSLLYQNPNVMAPGTVNPLARTHDAPKDEYTINPRDAGMRVILPGTAGATDTYRVRVRSGSPDLSNLEGGLTTGVYDLQIRLREQDEVAGSTVDTADIRFATNGIELVGLPAHSPLTGEAAEKRDANGNDTNNSLAAPDDLGNLMNTDRGTLSVAGVLDGTTDVDWYQFDIRYDALPFYQDDDTKHLATVFDIDYADGFSRANTNLWVFDDQGRLIYTGSDSNVADDRPVQDSEFSADLARGSLGELDPYIGTVELPAESLVSTGRYYVAVTSNATLPEEMLQYLTATPTNPLVRAEPVNSVKRIAEDRINSLGLYTTADAPTVPVLFGDEDEVQFFVPDGSQVKDGERIRIDNRAGFWETYEFDADGIVADGNIPISYDVGWTADEMAAAVAQTISFNPPQSFSGSFNPTADQPVIQSDLFVFSTLGGVVILQESVFEEVLLNEVTTTGFFGTPSVQQITRFNSYQTAPKVRQMLAFSESELSVQVSRPAALPYTLGDLTLFVTEEGARDRTELVSVDPFTGQMETRIGAFSANVGDVAMHPRGGSPGVGNEGGLFAYSIPETNPFDDTTTGHYWQVNPGLPTPNELGVDLGDDGVDTYIEDPANPGNSIRAQQGGAQNGVGISYNAITFNNQEQDSQVRGYAIGTRGDVFVDPFTGELTSFANGIPNPANILFEFNPNTGAVTNPPGVQDRTAAGILRAGGTQKVERGALDTSVDAFPAGGGNTTVTAVPATGPPSFFGGGNSTSNIEDGDFFEIDQNGDGFGDIAFEFDTGPEFFINLSTANPAAPQVIQDGDSFLVDGVGFEFDTGTVINVTAQNGGQLTDGTVITITDNQTTPNTETFEFDSNGTTAAGNIPVPFTNTSNSQAIIVALMAAINNAPNFAVTAVQLPGTTRISLIGESVTSGATSNAQGIVLSGAPGVAGGAIGISVEETSTTDQIGQSIMAVIDGNQTGGFVAGAAYDRLNFTNALVVDFAGVAQPIFTAAGVPGTLNNLALPVPFLASDNSADIAQRITQVLIGAGFSATQSGSSVFLASVPFGNPQPTFVCTNLATPPDVGADGIPDCPLLTGGTAPGGNITGMAFVGDELYAVTDTGGLFRVADSGGGSFSTNSSRNVADYVDGSRELLEQANATTSFRFDPVSGEFVETVVTEPIRFSGLVAGPENTEDGRYRNMLFGITDEGRLFAFNTHGEPQPVFANGAFYVDTEIFGANGIAFGNLDDNLWHITGDRNLDAGHGIFQAPDESRGTSVSAGSSFYFGYEDPTVQDQFGSQNFRPATPANTYDFPGGSHGSLLSNPFSLKGYSEGDLPTLYFNYFLESEDTDSTENTTLLSANERMRDAFRVYVSGDDGSWKLLTTNNSDRDAPPDDDYIDEFDPFFIIDPETGDFKAEQPFQRADAYDNGPTWRQARVDLSPYAGQENLRLRFDFSTAGGMSTGGNDIQLDLNTAGNELRAIEGAKLQDGQTFTLSDGGFLGEVFEFDMGPTIVAPTGAGIADGGYFEINGTVYEFDLDGSVGMTNNIPHIPIPYTGTETATGVVDRIIDVLAQTPPPPIEYEVNLTDSEPNDTLGTATDSLLDGSTQTYRGTARIGDNTTLVDVTRDVDMVAVQLQQGDKLVAETDTSRLATQLDTYIRLFDENGNELTANDNAEPNNPFNRDSKIEYTITERGTYYVAISGAQNVDYDPTIPESGSISGTVASLGFYEFSIAISDPMGPQVVGNRLNLPNLTEIVPTNLPDGFVDGSGGVSTPPFGSPVTPVRIHAAMTNLEVADAIQVAVADRLAGGNVDSIVRRHEVVVIHGYEVLDSGPLGISGPSDPETANFGSGLFGDSFGAFDVSSGFNGQTSAFAPGAQRMWDNQHEGVYIDDVIIGFAERGEMITNSTPSQDPIFSANPAEPANEITVGEYQLEIRQSTKYGLSDPNPVFPNLELYDTFDTNQRLADGVTLIARGGEYLADGQTLTVSDGSRTIIFEFEDITISNGVAPEHMALEFDPGDSDLIIARRIRDAINSTEAHQYLDLVAANSDGISQGVDSTSPLVHLFGNAVVTVGLTGPGLDGSVPVGEGNDTLADAVITGIVGGGRESYHATGLIGDNGAVAPLSADVDLFQVELLAGELLTIDIDASENGSPLDSILRVFDATGAPVMQTDFFGQMTPIISDDDTAPDEDVLLYPQLEINRDPYLVFVAPADGTYYIGVSGFDNDVYDATTEGSGRHGSTGRYELRIERPLNSTGLAVVEYRGTGDQNLPREQGQILIRNSRILNSSEFGVVATAGPRGTDSAPTPGPARNLAEVNTSGLVPGVTIVNNVLADNAFGGIDISGDPGGAGLQPATLPLARIINNTVIGNTGPVGTGQVGVGIRVGNNASPTLLNNVLSSVGTGIEVDATSQSSVIGGSLYHNNMTNTTGIGLGDFPIVADANTKLFVDPQNLNYYPAPDSPVIDSSIDSLEDRPELIQIRKPLGIPESPILTPTTDGAGQLRSDDPTVAPPPGIGENVFKDRGAIDRADFAGPEAKLISPLDNGPLDRDPSTTQINLVSASLNEFSIQLSDRTLQGTGIGIDDSTVNAGAVLITEGDRLLQEGVDYIFSYDPTNNIIRLTPLAGLWNSDSNYLIEMVRNDRFVLQVPAGNLISDGDEFTVTGDLGSVVNYEYDSGYVLHVPQTYAIQVPQQGGGIKGIEDGDTITIDNGVTTAVIELDNDGAADTVNHTVVSFTPESSQGEIVDALVTALGQVGVGLSPANAGSGLVHLGVDGSQSVTLQSTTMILVGSATGVIDGDSFTIDDGTRVVEFTFGTGSGGGGTVTQPVNFDASLTYEQLADNIAVAVAASNLGLNPLALEDGHVYLGGGLNHLVNVDNSGLILVGEPGATQAWGFRIPTSAGSFQGLVTDGQVFTLSNAAGVSVTFEFDDDTTVTPGNTAVPFTGNTTTGQLANSLVTIIRNARDGAVPLGLFPFYAGDGIISLGGDATYAIDVTGSTLAELGAPGVPASVPIPYIPGERFEAVDVAAVTADVINAQVPSVVEAVAVGDTVYINRATQVVVPLFDDDQDPNTPPVPVGPLMVSDGSSVRDLAGNPLEPNQSDGGTRFTIFVGQGADYGDAPAPYPTTRADDGARHIVLEGFSLGLTVSIDADGKPSPGADADDDDGVFFNANTPIVPGRTFSLTVLTSGIGSVVNFGILEAWMDYNRDGDWEDSGERIIGNTLLSTGNLNNGAITFSNLRAPASAIPGPTYARFRLSTEGTGMVTGEATAGEVEDYLVQIQTNPWQNPLNPLDVDADGYASPVDVLTLINYINENPNNLQLPLPKPPGTPFLDPNGDGFATAQDVLQVITYLNEVNSGGAGEGEAAPNHLDDVLSLDADWDSIVDDVDRAMGSADGRDEIFAQLAR